MALNTEYDIVKAFEAIEDELMASMIRNMKDHKLEEIDENKQWSMWQAEQLKSLEKYRRSNQKKFGSEFDKINRKIEALIRTARDEGEMDQEIEILKAIKKGFKARKVSPGVAVEFFKINDRKLDALIDSVNNDMKKAETAILRMANDQYRKIIYNAQVYANTGAGTYEKAVDMATKDFIAAGLNCVEYANGARHSLKDYADMAIRTASKRAYLQGEGTKRQEWGISTVIVNKRGNPCPKCLPFCGKVLIDDVWSGGSKKDGNYPLMSYAIQCGLYHPRCRDVHSTYFPGISRSDDTWTKEELEAIGIKSKEEAKQQYAKRQEERFERLSKFSLDEENQQNYKQKANIWKNVRFKTGNMSSNDYVESKRPLADFRAVPQESVVNVLRKESEKWIEKLTNEEKRAIRKYTYNSWDNKPNKFFERLNKMLRGDADYDEKLQEYADTISKAIKKSRIDKDIICYRNLDINLYRDYDVNDIFIEDQFISTSVVKSAALDKPYKVTIYVPKGSLCAYIESISKFPKQRELLLDKGNKYRVLSKKENEIELEVIP